MIGDLPRRPRNLLSVIGTALLVGGCASFSADGGFGTVKHASVGELGATPVRITNEAEAASASARVRALLKRPLSAQTAVEIALLNNRGLQAAYNDLGISEAQYVAASLPPNPRISLSRLAGAGELEIERQLAFNLLSLATLPARREIAEGGFRAAQLRAAEATLRLGAETRRQYYRAVAANQAVGFLSQAKLSTDASSELAQKLGESGGINKLDQAREFSLGALTAGQLARARLQQKLEREKLVRHLGLWGNDLAFSLPRSLPALPRKPRSLPEVEADALKRRVDLQIARIELESLAKSLGLTQAVRFVSDIELAGVSKYARARTVSAGGGIERDKTSGRGLDLAIEIPIFDFGQARVAEAEQTYMKAANLFAQRAVNIRSEAREAYQAYRGAYDIARHYQNQIVPLAKEIQDQALLQYSGMLVDVSQLITDARNRILVNAQAIDARRDFWIAETDLRVSLAGGGAGGSSGMGSATAPAGATATD
jgi:outer membrane protein TolC